MINNIYNTIKKNKGKTLGGLLGLIAAILVLSIGFIKTLFIYMIVGLGSFIGKKYDEGLSLIDILKGFINIINKEGM